MAGACGFGAALGAADQPSVSPDGRSVYIASEGGKSLTVFKVESAPACRDTSAATGYQTPVTIALSCIDADGDPVMTSVLAGPTHGTLGAVGPAVTYTPAAGYTGSDSFTYVAGDGTNTSAPATVTITVGARPPAPTLTTPPPSALLTKVSQSHRRWRESKHGGTTFSFTLNTTARVTFTFTRKRHQRPLGVLTITGHRGHNRLAFNGRISRHRTLKPGTYTVTIRTGASTKRLTFTIVK